MASNPPPFQVEDNTDEDFFDKLVNDDDDDVIVRFNKPPVVSAVASAVSTVPSFADWNESDEAKAFASLSLSEVDGNISEVSSSKKGVGGVGVSDSVDGLVEAVDEVATAEESGGVALVSSNSLDDFVENDHGVGVGDSLSDRTVVSKSSGESLSEAVAESKSSGESLSEAVVESKGGGAVSGAPGVKEVDWSKFHADLSQNDGNGFGSYSDFFNELGGESNAADPFADLGTNNVINGVQDSSGTDVYGLGSVETSNNYGQYVDGYTQAVAADQSAEAQDLNSSQYWENQYPGWKYDASTGQWYEVPGYDPAANAQESVNSNQSSAWDGQAEISYLQQTSQPVTGTVAETGTTQSVTNWDQFSQPSGDTSGVSTDGIQASQESNGGYPPHMVFDPQYPGWYYDTIVQQWLSLESYNASHQSAGQVQEQTRHNEYVSADAYSQNNYQKTQSMPDHANRYMSEDVNSGGQDQSWAQPVSNYNHQTAFTWQPVSTSSDQVALSYRENQITENTYEQNIPADVYGSQQNSINYPVSDSYNENFNQTQNNFFVPSVSQGFTAARNLSQPFHDQNNRKNISTFQSSDQNSFTFPQHQFQRTQVSHDPAAGRSSAGRPAHALVTFGFGGKLIVMKNNSSAGNLNFGSQNPAGSSISVLNLAEVVNDYLDASSHGIVVGNYFQSLYRQPVPGPLTGGSFGKELNKWIDEKIANSESAAGADYRKAEGLRLLFSLLKIACQYYGKLRSPYGSDAVLKENDSPESAVARLFASARRNSVQFSQYGAVAQCLQQMPSEQQMRVTASEVQSLLASGRKKEALECAKDGQLWGPALVLATQLGDQFYVETVKQMALRHLVAGSPLRTLCLLIAGQPRDVFSPDNTAVSSVPGTAYLPQQPSQVGANGMLDDWEENLAVITANRTQDDELVLMHLGDCLWKDRSDIIAAHICYLVAEATFEPYSDSARLCLVGADHWKFPRTYASPEAIQRTEIYEYTKTLGNSQFVLLPFQPYKLVYAHMLAEVGKMSDALKYCQAVLKSLKVGRAPEVENLRHLISSLEERIKAHQQGGFSTNLAAPKKLVGKLLNLFDSTANRVSGPPIPAPTSGGMTQGIENHHQSMAPRVSSSQSTLAMSTLENSQSVEPISAWGTKHTRSASEPDFKSPRQGQADHASSTDVQEQGSAGGVTSRFGRFGFGSQLLQKTVGLVLKPRQGRQAKLGETNKFYYDEKLQRWVEEGAEPPAEQAALPPPPTSTVFQNGTSDYNLKSALKSEASHSNGAPEFKSPSAVDNNPGMPPLPPTSNQYSARGRMGVRSRYVDTFNQGSAHAASSFKSPSVPSIKPPSGANPKFFVPSPISAVEQQVDASVDSMQDTSSTYEHNSSSPASDSFQSPPFPSSTTMQRFASMNSISGKGASDNGSFSVHSRRTASWSGSFNDAFSPPDRAGVKPLGEVLGMSPSSFMPSDPSLVHSSMNGGSFGDDLHEVEL